MSTLPELFQRSAVWCIGDRPPPRTDSLTTGFTALDRDLPDGARPQRLLLVQPDKPAVALWAAERILRDGTCVMAVLWLAGPVDYAALRRLQLAAGSSFSEFGASSIPVAIHIGVIFHRRYIVCAA